MTKQSTINKLVEMRMSAMANAFYQQTQDSTMRDIPFEDRFGMLVDIEYYNRKDNLLKRLIKNAQFDQPHANIVDINYSSGRNLNTHLIQRLATCEYIREHYNLFLTGAAGSGKSFLACALGMEACKQYYSTRYVRLPDLLLDLQLSHGDDSYKKIVTKYTSPVLLIIDEWLLFKPNEQEQRIILELLHRRHQNTSTIFCSQFHPDGWYERITGIDSSLVDAILDRVMHNSYKINIESIDPSKDISMREVYGLKNWE